MNIEFKEDYRVWLLSLLSDFLNPSVMYKLLKSPRLVLEV